MDILGRMVGGVPSVSIRGNQPAFGMMEGKEGQGWREGERERRPSTANAPAKLDTNSARLLSAVPARAWGGAGRVGLRKGQTDRRHPLAAEKSRFQNLPKRK